MMGIEIHTEEFEQALTEVEMRVHTMVNTLQEVARLVESTAEPLVPYDFDKPRSSPHLLDSFVAVPTGEASRGWIEVEIGYSALDPRDYYDYAEYTHKGIDYRTGSPIHWQKPTAESQYLLKGLNRSFDDAMRLIKGDYLSMFGGLGTIEYD